MISLFLNNLDKLNLYNDISQFILNLETIINSGDIQKQYTNIIWFLINSLEIITQYDMDYEDINLLNEDSYQNILDSIKKLINKQYYGFTK